MATYSLERKQFWREENRFHHWWTLYFLRNWQDCKIYMWNKTENEIYNNVQASNLPAPQSPDGLRPICIESFFILFTNRKAVIDTSWVLSPNSSRLANLNMYRHGSEKKKKNIILHQQQAEKIPVLALIL